MIRITVSPRPGQPACHQTGGSPILPKAVRQGIDESALPMEEKKEREIMRLLPKVKNGTPVMRKQALRQLTDKAREFGPFALINQVLPLLMSFTREDQERHLLVKVRDQPNPLRQAG